MQKDDERSRNGGRTKLNTWFDVYLFKTSGRTPHFKCGLKRFLPKEDSEYDEGAVMLEGIVHIGARFYRRRAAGGVCVLYLRKRDRRKFVHVDGSCLRVLALVMLWGHRAHLTLICHNCRSCNGYCHYQEQTVLPLLWHVSPLSHG